jgi:hypothetical protein
MRLMAATVLTGFAVLAAAPAARAQAADLPAGWIRAGDHPAEYEMAVDPKGGKSGKACAFICGRTADPQGFGTLMQTFDAAECAGKRLRLSASVKSEGITKWAGLWMRVDGATPPGQQRPAVLAFDNMQNRPITGNEWLDAALAAAWWVTPHRPTWFEPPAAVQTTPIATRTAGALAVDCGLGPSTGRCRIETPCASAAECGQALTLVSSPTARHAPEVAAGGPAAGTSLSGRRR